jgi:Flp pilus assembly protein TadD
MLYALGYVYYKQGRYDEAIALFNQLTRREAQHRLAYTALGLCYEMKGDKAQARTNYQRAIEVAPNEPYTNTAREHLAKL